MDTDTSGSAREFLDGIVLFNQGRFFDCHEAWEVAWKRAEGHDRLMLQGLIQVAVALLHVERGNLRGARSVYAKARAKLDPLPPVMMGLDLDAFRTALAAYFENVLAENAVPSHPVLRIVS